MKFTFKIQQYQTDAVNAVVNVFAGQPIPSKNELEFKHEVGVEIPKDPKLINLYQEEMEQKQNEVLGYANAPIKLTDASLFGNILKVQDSNNINHSDNLVKDQGRCNLDIEMETGTGKTYVYIKTMFELNKHYGWNKFIVVVPSIAIREGVKKTFEMTEEHFMQQYQKKARYFIYDSSNLTKLDDFATSKDINVMIINNQAFASSMNEEKNKEGRGGDKVARIIYGRPDSFGSRRPIDVIAQTNPILILDEPQKLGGKATKNSLLQFNPMFSINYSATHKEKHNLVYVLDALDSFNQKLVKKIQVKGIEVANLKGIDSYLYMDEVVLSKNKPPRVRLEFEMAQANGAKRLSRIFSVGDDLYALSNNMLQYKGFVVSDINPSGTGTVTFTNGEEIHGGDVVGDVAEIDKRRIQIRETISSHFEKEEKLFAMGIKTLSLFFIDEVAKYRIYNENDEPELGEYGKIFEEEYEKIFNGKIQELFDTPYVRYLKNMAADTHAVHTGYFSIDKKGKSIDSKVERGKDYSSDVSAYDLIMKNKEMLLDLNNPVRFIFSHSALREGWDNPNVFQICTLKHSNSETNKRQEVGRGMRLCVNQNGERMDEPTLGSNVHDINLLTVISSESYTDFVEGLQKDISENIYNRPTVANVEYFTDRVVNVEGHEYKIYKQDAEVIKSYLDRNNYIDYDGKVTDEYREAVANDSLAPLPEKIADLAPAVHKLVQAIFDKNVFKEMIENGKNTNTPKNDLNDNFKKTEFQKLWNEINHKYAYKVSFDSDELVKKSVNYLNANLQVTKVQYVVTSGVQKDELRERELQAKSTFLVKETKQNELKEAHDSGIKYDLIHEIASRTSLTRKTTVRILKGLVQPKLEMFRNNPEDFIRKVAKVINEQKAGLIVDHVTYNLTDEKFDSNIFAAEHDRSAYDKAFRANKHIQDYVFTDGTAEKSVERRFAEALDVATEVAVYAKLPRGFYIPTPVGKYSPDWAIAFKEGSVKHIYFIAETKGTNSSLELRPIEKAKIACADKLFEKLSDGKVHYGQVKDYSSLMDIVKH